MKHYSFDNVGVRLAGLRAAREFLGPMFADRERELVIVALCDSDIRLMQLLSIPGTDAYVRFSLADILRRAICREDCAGIIMAHNHPSGDVRPSQEDLKITRRMSLVTEALDLTLLDHLIFNDGPAFSFREAGYL